MTSSSGRQLELQLDTVSEGLVTYAAFTVYNLLINLLAVTLCHPFNQSEVGRL